MLGHHWPVRETPFKWHFAGRLLMACYYWYLHPSSPHQTKKKHVKIGPPLTKLSGSTHAKRMNFGFWEISLTSPKHPYTIEGNKVSNLKINLMREIINYFGYQAYS